MANTDNSVDSLLIDGGLVIAAAATPSPPMHPPVRRAEKITTPSASRVDE